MTSGRVINGTKRHISVYCSKSVLQFKGSAIGTPKDAIGTNFEVPQSFSVLSSFSYLSSDP